MVDEDCFQKALDAHPDDQITRAVFADWLEERNDPRAAGYRHMASIGFVSCRVHDGRLWVVGRLDNPDFGPRRIGNYDRLDADRYDSAMIEPAWFARIDGVSGLKRNTPYWRHYPTRRELEDAVARAYSPGD